MSQTAKRPLSQSSLADLSSEFASVSKPPDPSHQAKKMKVDDISGKDAPETLVPDAVHAEIRSAINTKNALDNIRMLPQLGYCPSKVQQYRKSFRLDNDKRFKTSLDGRFRKRDRATQAAVNVLADVYKDIKDLSVSYTSGKFNIPFHLRVTRPGCEYNKKVQKYPMEIRALLRTWFEHSAVSGYGDMHSLETKVDYEVRNAREIPASEFEVEPEFLLRIQKEWGNHFIPRNVRAEPYKIHLYGPGGHFKSHRDTPETGLVGTFLVGLADSTSNYMGHFRIGEKTLRADTFDWVAFHPDISHEVTKLEDGHRAVMAFKMFRVADSESDDTFSAKLEVHVKKILDEIPAPFGLFTTHQYSIGTTELNGFDSLLSACARSRNDTKVHMLPVVTEFVGEAYDDEEYGDSSTQSRVYPFTGSHVDILLARDAVQAKKAVQWLDGLSEIPFYTWDIQASSVTWQHDEPEGARYTGNQADSSREDSIYLSYAILFLPRSE